MIKPKMSAKSLITILQDKNHNGKNNIFFIINYKR